MSDTLRTNMIRLAATLPRGSQERKALLNILAGVEDSIAKELRKRGYSSADIKSVLRSERKRVLRMDGGGFSAQDIADILETYEPLSYR